MQEIDCLVLDFSLFPAAPALREALRGVAPTGVEHVTTNDLDGMTEADWDEVLEQLQRARRCITL